MTQGEFQEYVEQCRKILENIPTERGGYFLMTTSDCKDSETGRISNLSINSNTNIMATYMVIMLAEDEKWKRMFEDIVVLAILSNDEIRKDLVEKLKNIL